MKVNKPFFLEGSEKNGSEQTSFLSDKVKVFGKKVNLNFYEQDKYICFEDGTKFPRMDLEFNEKFVITPNVPLSKESSLNLVKSIASCFIENEGKFSEIIKVRVREKGRLELFCCNHLSHFITQVFFLNHYLWRGTKISFSCVRATGLQSHKAPRPLEILVFNNPKVEKGKKESLKTLIRIFKGLKGFSSFEVLNLYKVIFRYKVLPEELSTAFYKEEERENHPKFENFLFTFADWDRFCRRCNCSGHTALQCSPLQQHFSKNNNSNLYNKDFPPKIVSRICKNTSKEIFVKSSNGNQISVFFKGLETEKVIKETFDSSNKLCKIRIFGPSGMNSTSLLSQVNDMLKK